jgi:hypothetical protein
MRRKRKITTIQDLPKAQVRTGVDAPARAASSKVSTACNQLERAIKAVDDEGRDADFLVEFWGGRYAVGVRTPRGTLRPHAHFSNLNEATELVRTIQEVQRYETPADARQAIFMGIDRASGSDMAGVTINVMLPDGHRETVTMSGEAFRRLQENGTVDLSELRRLREMD